MADGLQHKPPIEVKCPTCKGIAIYAANNPWRPFCSQRCREIDLGAWASERFALPAEGDNLLDPDQDQADEAAALARRTPPNA